MKKIVSLLCMLLGANAMYGMPVLAMDEARPREVKALPNKQVAVNHLDIFECNAIHSNNFEFMKTMLHEHPELVHKVYSHGSFKGATMLHIAMKESLKHGDMRIVRLILFNLADYDALDRYQRTPLEYALENSGQCNETYKKRLIKLVGEFKKMDDYPKRYDRPIKPALNHPQFKNTMVKQLSCISLGLLLGYGIYILRSRLALRAARAF